MKSLDVRAPKHLSFLETGNAHLVILLSKESNAALSKMLGLLTREQGKNGLYVAINKNCKSILTSAGKQIDESKLFFLNVVPGVGGKQEKICSCIYISSPYALTELSLAVVSAIKTGRYSFLVLDSVETLEIYHEPKVIEKFIHYLNNILSENNVNCFIIAHNGKAKESRLISIIAHLCDNVVKI